MDEAALKRGLKKRFQRIIPRAQVLRHEDQFAAGRSDFSIHVPPRAAWVEVKYDRPDSSGKMRRSKPTPLQLRFLVDLDGFLVTYRTDHDGSGSVVVERPRYPGRVASRSDDGHDHEHVARVVKAYLEEDEPAQGTDPFEMVRAFHEKFDLPRPVAPTFDAAAAWMRHDHLEEEVQELADAIGGDGNLVEVADALADIIYLAIGTAVNLGIPLREVFAEVHRSNLEKRRAPGASNQSTSKQGIVKPPGWRAPDVAGVLRRYGWSPRKEAA